jgi:CBS domain containing-hemolysin-like protein
MASGRELCYCMLLGISLCYLVTFVLVSKPSTYICASSRVLIGLSMAAVYAAILVKTNRLARVFKPSSAIRPKFISPPAQVGICCSIVSVQLIGSLIWLIVDPPNTAVQYPTRIGKWLIRFICSLTKKLDVFYLEAIFRSCSYLQSKR